jgi:hypothetical protein
MPGTISTLVYSFDSTDEYADPKPVEVTNEDATFRLAEGLLTVRLHSPTPTIRRARDLVEPLLRAWEFEGDVRGMPRCFRFAFQRAFLGNSAPDEALNPPEALQYERTETGPLVIALRVYPEAPSILLSPEMEAIWKRYKRASLDIGEPLASCAYFALTVLERSAGGRMEAARRFAIEPSVLRKLGELTTLRGDLTTARKALEPSAMPLSRSERNWIDHVVRYALIHMGMVNAGTSPILLKMADLPAI